MFLNLFFLYGTEKLAPLLKLIKALPEQLCKHILGAIGVCSHLARRAKLGRSGRNTWSLIIMSQIPKYPVKSIAVTSCDVLVFSVGHVLGSLETYLSVESQSVM